MTQQVTNSFTPYNLSNIEHRLKTWNKKIKRFLLYNMPETTRPFFDKFPRAFPKQGPNFKVPKKINPNMKIQYQ